ncbi:MAG: lipoyl synthase [Candidatus Brocadiaceae bacterium]|nr:lipoyl synthase [Candidatus Brocadiaceae bacterium]
MRIENPPAFLDGAELQPAAGNKAERKAFPPWLRKRRTGGGSRVSSLISGLGLKTVCQEALCPNIEECFSRGTATFLILGGVCTRGCSFCGVRKGTPAPPDGEEPLRLARAVRRMGLRYVVVTSVTRDDLPDGGSAHYKKTIQGLREIKGVEVEVLVPDFQGRQESLTTVLEAGPDILSHNIETVPRLYPQVRQGASYKRSLRVLAFTKKQCKNIKTKSGVMLGLGESRQEVLEVLADLREVGCDVLTIGQYLRPTREQLPVQRYLEPEEFEEYKRLACSMSFQEVKAGPFVRSSYYSNASLEGLER